MAQLFDINITLIIWKLKLTSVIFSVIFGFLTVYFTVLFQKLIGVKAQMVGSMLRVPEPASGGAVTSKWGEIMRHFESEKEAEWKFAIIEADNLVDDLLKSAGYPGDTMGERLMGIEKVQLLSLDGLWEAHKIRNKLVHDINYFLRYAEARRAIRFYEKTLEELQILP